MWSEFVRGGTAAFARFGARGVVLEEIGIRRQSGIAHVTLNRPPVGNAVTLAMWRELAEIFSRFTADRNLRAVVLEGGGRNFSVGADISEFDKIRNDSNRAPNTRSLSTRAPARLLNLENRWSPRSPAIVSAVAAISLWRAIFASRT
jgi:1,4-dihydroxy-2-naphthoyl-CoA synthase